MKRLTNKQALRLFTEKRERYREFKKMESHYERVKARWYEARRISEIYKGRAIYVSPGLGGRIEGSGISNSRRVFATQISFCITWTIDCYQNNRTMIRYSFTGNKKDLIMVIKEYLLTGRWSESREPRRKK